MIYGFDIQFFLIEEQNFFNWSINLCNNLRSKNLKIWGSSEEPEIVADLLSS